MRAPRAQPRVAARPPRPGPVESGVRPRGPSSPRTHNEIIWGRSRIRIRIGPNCGRTLLGLSRHPHPWLAGGRTHVGAARESPEWGAGRARRHATRGGLAGGGVRLGEG